MRLDATSLQLPGVLDELYFCGGRLGVTFDRGVPSLRVWAPTARSVTLHLFDGPGPAAAESSVPGAPDCRRPGTTGPTGRSSRRSSPAPAPARPTTSVPGPPRSRPRARTSRRMLRVRRSTSLLRLRTACEIQTQLSFLNVGPDQVPGLVALRITPPPASAPCGEPTSSGGGRGEVVALVNAAPETRSFAAPSLAGQRLRLHPVQRESADPVVRGAGFDCRTGTFTIPARTAAVFVSRDGQADGCGEGQDD